FAPYRRNAAGDFEIGKRADGDRLERGARPIGADFGDRLAADIGDDRRDERAADPALARPHTAAGEGLELVRAGRPKPRGTADPTDRHLLAAAYDDIVLGRDHHRARRPIEAVEKRPQRPLAVERCPD